MRIVLKSRWWSGLALPPLPHRYCFALVTAVALAGCETSKVDGSDPSSPIIDRPPVALVAPFAPVIVARAGGAGYAPENTMSAIRNAVRLGVKYVEVDVVVTGDNRVAVTHDDNPSRTTNCTKSISSSNWTSLMDCDAAYWWRAGVAYTNPSTAATPLRGAGVRIPELGEVIDYIKSSAPQVEKLIVEVKVNDNRTAQNAIAATVVSSIVAAHFEDRAIVASFSVPLVDYAKALAPQIDSAVVVGPGSRFTDCILGAQYAIGRGHTMILAKSDSTSFDSRCTTYARDGGVRVFEWTIDRPETLVSARSRAVDAVISNFPACLKEEMGEPYPMPIYTSDLAQPLNSPRCAIR